MNGSMSAQAQGQCRDDVGSRPYWMGVDQYDPCPCILPAGHGGQHQCEHTLAKSDEATR